MRKPNLLYMADLAQLVERLFRKQKVSGSNLLIGICSTNPLCNILQRLNRQAWGTSTQVDVPEREMKRVRMVTFFKGRCESFHSSKQRQTRRSLEFLILIILPVTGLLGVHCLLALLILAAKL